MRIGQTSILLTASKYSASIISFLATVYFARILGAEVLGYYSLVLVVTKWFALTGDIGVASAVNKRISETEEPSSYFTAGIIIVTILSCFLIGIIVVARSQINSYIGINAWMFVAAITPLAILYSTISSSLKGERRVHLVALLTPIQALSRSGTQIALVLVGYELTGLIFGYTASFIITAVAGLWFISLNIELPEKKHFKNIYSFARFAWLGKLRGRSFNDIDVLVLGALVSPQLVGIYSVAWGITNFIGIFGSSIQNTLFPEMSYANAKQNDGSVSKLLCDSLTYSGLVAIPGVFGSALLADRLLRIYGGEFTRGAAVLSLLVLAMLIYDYQNQLLNVLNAVDRPEIAFRVNGAFILMNLTLNVVFVYTFGWTGAAVATVLAATCGVLLSFRYLNRIIEFHVPTSEIGRQLIATLVMAVVVGTTRYGIEAVLSEIHNTIFVIALVGLGAGVYFVTLLVISSRFRTTVTDNSPIRLPFIS